MLTYQDEKDLALEYMLDKFFTVYKTPTDKQEFMAQQISLELYLTPDCNQNCSYCYLCKYKDQLYPKELRDFPTILKNTQILLDYLIENNMNPHRFDLFSGEIWDTQFGYDVLETVYQAVLKGFKPVLIVIPSNMSFVLKDDSLSIIDSYMDKFKEKGIKVCFSCSNDGWHLDKMTRPFNNENEYELKKGTKAYYDRLFDFCAKWDLGFHPMISAHGIEHWEDNFDWWMETLIERGFNPLSSIMFLEVRNDDWTDDKIIHYLKYLNHSADYWAEKYFPTQTNPDEALFMFQKWIHHKLNTNHQTNYTPLLLSSHSIHPGCTIHRSVIVRMGDLAIVPCHRTSYDEFIGGHFKVEDEKIVGVHADNIQVMNQVWLNNMQGSPKCGNCPYTSYCMKGCFGSQFESTGDLLYPCKTVCNLYIARFIFLYHKYTKMGVLIEPEDKEIENIINQIKDTEEYKKWTQISLQII